MALIGRGTVAMVPGAHDDGDRDDGQSLIPTKATFWFVFAHSKCPEIFL